MSANERVEAEIDLSAVLFNMESMHRRLRPGTRMIAVVKTDAYGHGAAAVAKTVEVLPYVWGFAVATFEEAQQLRGAGIRKPVLILGYTFPSCYREMAAQGIRPAVFRPDTVGQLEEAAAAQGLVMPVHVAVDTGMSRIGIRPDDEGLSFVRKVQESPHLLLEGMFTHFARADEKSGAEVTAHAFEQFTSFIRRIQASTGYHIPLTDCSNSASIVLHPDRNLDLVRAGITMYGMWPSEEVPKDLVPLRPVLSLHSQVVYIKTIPAGTPVSYGGTFVAQKPTRVATIPVGYGDGYPRSLSNRGTVLIRGHRIPIIGRVCMDQFMADVTAFPEIAEGDRVTLIGTDGSQTITAEEVGGISGRFNYELTCDLNQRVPRVYRGGNP